MNIAYYDLGNITNPINKIHDKQGNAVLKKEEIVIFKEEGVKCKIIKMKSKKTWRKMGSKIVFYDTIKGVLIRTEKRFIYIREPQFDKYLDKKINKSELALHAKTWNREGKFESFSLPVDEIINMKRFKKASRIYIEDDENRYRLLILFEFKNKI